MFEADSFCMLAWLYSALMSLSGLHLFWWLDLKPGWELLADFVLIIWVGLTIWGLTWMKVWMAKPTFNSGTFRNVLRANRSRRSCSVFHGSNGPLHRVRSRVFLLRSRLIERETAW